jgi:CubicO group peptidase (beta-lactamase class C family)
MADRSDDADPPYGRVVDLAAWDKGPDNRWAFQHVGEIIPTAVVSRGDGTATTLAVRPSDVTSLRVENGGTEMTVGDVLRSTYTDGLIVLADGEVVHEEYFNGMGPHTRHLLMSVSKSLVGTLVGVFVADGRLDPDSPIVEYLPELRSSPGFADATIRHLLDMTTAIEFSEEYDDPDSEVAAHERAMGWRGRSPFAERGLYAFAETIGRANRSPGAEFHYASINADVLGWLVERVAGRRFVDVMGDVLWSRLGVDHDALLSVDHRGSAVVNGGFCLTLRDLARFGQMVLDDGRANGAQIVPHEWLDDIRHNGDNSLWRPTVYGERWPDGWYRSQWYVTGDDHGSMFAIGVNGQHVWIDPATRAVVAKLSSMPKSVDEPLTALAFDAIETVARARPAFDDGQSPP